MKIIKPLILGSVLTLSSGIASQVNAGTGGWCTVVNARTPLNIRIAPGAENPIIGTLKNGSPVNQDYITYYDSKGRTWKHIIDPSSSIEGYVRAKYLKCED